MSKYVSLAVLSFVFIIFVSAARLFLDVCRPVCTRTPTDRRTVKSAIDLELTRPEHERTCVHRWAFSSTKIKYFSRVTANSNYLFLIKCRRPLDRSPSEYPYHTEGQCYQMLPAE